MAAGIFYEEDSVWKGRQLVLSQIFGVVGKDEAPFWNYIKKTHLQGDGVGTTIDGFAWEYDVLPDASPTENAQVEGGLFPSEEHFVTGKLSNTNQIFMSAFGISGTAAARKNNRTGIEAQSYKSLIGLAKDIDKALIINTTSVGATKTIKGKLMGLAGLFGTHNEVDAGSKVLTIEMIEALGMLFADSGIKMTTLMMNLKQKQKFNRFFEEGIRIQEGRKDLSLTNIQRVNNVIGFTNSLDILVDHNVKDDEIIVFDRNGLMFNSFREEKDKDISQPNADKKSFGHLIEGTLLYETPMSVGRIKNLTLQ